jgi:hypothetical protein
MRINEADSAGAVKECFSMVHKEARPQAVSPCVRLEGLMSFGVRRRRFGVKLARWTSIGTAVAG